jgi:K+-transporting ATPase ATPase A chain
MSSVWASIASDLLFVLALLALTKPLGSYMAKVLQGEPTFLSGFLAPCERWIYHLSGVNPKSQQAWTVYARACLYFSFVNFAVFYLLLRLQERLPLRPNPLTTPMTPHLALNIAVSFMTNTSWQSYSGETTLSYLSQVLGITVQSFTSCAVGIAVGAALIRSFAREKTDTIGNFWTDLTRSTLYILFPLSLMGALLLGSLGVIQNWSGNHTIAGLEGIRHVVPMGPVASQESIKLLSGDGGGFFNANSAHPFENPSPFSDLIEMLLILAIPAGMTYTFGAIAGDRRQGWTIFAAMTILLCAGTGIVTWSEYRGTPNLHPNMEGKEVRFGIGPSALFSVVTTASADGAVNSAHDSFTPIGGLVQLFNLKAGDVIFGGAGTGLAAMIFMVLITVFLAGLMVGRTPEYLGKRIESREMKLVMISFVAIGAAILVLAAATFCTSFPENNVVNTGAHALSAILYAHASAVSNNGSAFAGIDANRPWFNVILAIAMLIGRFLVIVPVLAVAGSFAAKRRLPATSGTMPTHGPLFVALLIASIVLVAALTFLPALCLGPVAEHYLRQTAAVH